MQTRMSQSPHNSCVTPDPTPRLITARLPLEGGSGTQVQAGVQVHQSHDGAVSAYLVGLPYFLDPWLDADHLATRWREDRARVLDTLDGTFHLLVLDGDGFHLVNDKVSAATWFWCVRNGVVHASNGFKALIRAADVPLRFDYRAFRHQLQTKAGLFDMSVIQGVRKLRKGHILGRDLEPRQYYDPATHIVPGSTPEDYFAHLDHYISQVLRQRRVATLCSAGFDSMMQATLLSRGLEQFDVYTAVTDIYSEHRRAQRFLRLLPKQNFRVQTFGYSMAPGSPAYAPRRLHTHASTYLACVDDLIMSKDHLTFADILTQMRKEGVEVLVTGYYGDSVRRAVPIHLMYYLNLHLDALATPRVRELFADSDEQVAACYPRCEDELWQRLTHAQWAYTPAMFLNLGIACVALPACTARALALSRGIDRDKLPGRGGVNFYRDYVKQQVPGVRFLPYDTGLGAIMPFEQDWISQVLDPVAVAEELKASGVFDPQFVDFMVEHYGRSGSAHSSSQNFLHLWAWYCMISDRPSAFEASLTPLRRNDPYFQPVGPRRTLALAWRRLANRATATAFQWRHIRWAGAGNPDGRHPINRVRNQLKLAGHIFKHQGMGGLWREYGPGLK